MIGKIVLAALVAGMAAGFILSGIQYFKLSPLIAAAERYEQSSSASCVETMPGMQMCGNDKAWEPKEGVERLSFTTLASVVAGAGFAVALAGISLLSNVPITRQNGVIWGLCGFLCVNVATGAGLPPELPGMAQADLLQRQLWWGGTILVTGTGIYLVAFGRASWSPFLAIVLIALPHVIGAPEGGEGPSALPAKLAAQFAGSATAAMAVFWLLIGGFMGIILPRFTSDDRLKP